MKRVAFLVICMGAFALLFAAMGVALAGDASANTSSFSISPSVSPASISGPQEVTVTITITHLGETVEDISITLMDPNRNQVSLPNSKLSPGDKVTYSGKWAVSEAELANGRFVYNLSWGNTTRAIPVPISRATASSTSGSSGGSSGGRLTASYTITPEVASRGQTVTLAYTLHNGSDTDIIDVVITNSNLSSRDRVTIPRIGAGETVTQNYQYSMGNRSITSRPRVTYRVEGASRNTTISNIGTKTIRFERGGVTANLRTSSRTEVEPGTNLTLTLNLNNSSAVSYKDIKVTSPQLGDIATGIELRANNGRHSVTHTFAVEKTDEYAFLVTGTGSDGRTLDISSNFIRITALDMSRQLQLAIQATTDTLEIYEEPGIIDFVVSVRNTGEATGNDLVLMHGKTTIADIGTLAPGEERVVAKRLLASMHGTFGFSVIGLNGQGVSQTVTQDEKEMVYVAFATPPPPTPAPTERPTEPPEEEEDIFVSGATGDDSGNGMTLLWVLAGVLMAALAAVLGMIVVSRRRQAREKAQSESAIDSMERGPRRDYTGNTTKHKPIQDSPRRDALDVFDDLDVGLEYAQEINPPKPRPAKPAKPMEGVGLTSGMSMSELAAKYGRPEQPEQDETVPSRTVDDAASAYLARMREPAERDERGDPPEYTRRRRARSADA